MTEQERYTIEKDIINEKLCIWDYDDLICEVDDNKTLTILVNLLNKLHEENEELKKENNDLKTSKEYWREKCLSKDSYNKFHHKTPIWFTQELKLTNKEVNKVAEAIEQDLKERRIKE